MYFISLIRVWTLDVVFLSKLRRIFLSCYIHCTFHPFLLLLLPSTNSGSLPFFAFPHILALPRNLSSFFPASSLDAICLFFPSFFFYPDKVVHSILFPTLFSLPSSNTAKKCPNSGRPKSPLRPPRITQMTTKRSFGRLNNITTCTDGVDKMNRIDITTKFHPPPSIPKLISRWSGLKVKGRKSRD